MGNQYDYRQLREFINTNHDRFSELNFDSSMSIQQKMNGLVEWFKVMLKEYNDWIEYLDEFKETFDSKLYSTTDDILKKWLDDGLLTEFIRSLVNEEVKQARTSIKGYAYPKLTNRIDKIEGYENEINKKSDKVYVDNMLSSIAQGGPRELFYSLAALKAKYPNGADGTYLVFDSATINGAHSYMWDKSLPGWVDLGLYQAIKLNPKSVTYDLRSRMGSQGMIVGGEKLIIKCVNDGANKTIEFTDRFWIADGSKPIYIDAKTFNLGDGVGLILLDCDTLEIYIRSFSDKPNLKQENSLFLGIWFSGDYVYLNTNNKPYSINGKFQINKQSSGMIMSNSDIVINSALKEMDFSGVVIDSTGYIYNDVKTDISMLNTASPNIIYMDVATKTIKMSTNSLFQTFSNTPNIVLLGAIWSLDYNNYCTISTNSNVILDGVVVKKSDVDLYTKDLKIACLGDSITEGLLKGGGVYTDKPYPYWISRFFGGKVTNLGKSGGHYHGSETKDLMFIVNNNDYAEYDVVTVAYGINDWYDGNNLTDVINSLKAGLDKMYNDNNLLRVVALLPQMSYRLPLPAPGTEGEALTAQNSQGYTLNELYEALIEVYKEYQIPYLDWREAPVVTKRGYKRQTSDFLHINDVCHKIQGKRVSEFLNYVV